MRGDRAQKSNSCCGGFPPHPHPLPQWGRGCRPASPYWLPISP